MLKLTWKYHNNAYMYTTMVYENIHGNEKTTTQLIHTHDALVIYGHACWISFQKPSPSAILVIALQSSQKGNSNFIPPASSNDLIN